jgi:hypothetical protein
MPAPNQNFSVDLRSFDKALERLADLHPDLAGKTLRRQVVLLAIDIMERTPPGIGKGLSPAANQEGRKAVAFDIARVYPSVKKISAGEVAAAGDFATFQKWASGVQGNLPSKLVAMFDGISGRSGVLQKIVSGQSQKDFDAFKNIMSNTANKIGKRTIQNNFAPGFHQAAKGGRGRVAKGFQSSAYFVRLDGLAAYRGQVQARVGKLKAGWFIAIKNLAEGANHRKVPAWIKAAADESTGYSEDNSSASRMIASVAIANRIADKNGVSTRVSAIQSALAFRARMMGREYDEALKDLARKSGNK